MTIDTSPGNGIIGSDDFNNMSSDERGDLILSESAGQFLYGVGILSPYNLVLDHSGVETCISSHPVFGMSQKNGVWCTAFYGGLPALTKGGCDKTGSTALKNLARTANRPHILGNTDRGAIELYFPKGLGQPYYCQTVRAGSLVSVSRAWVMYDNEKEYYLQHLNTGDLSIVVTYSGVAMVVYEPTGVRVGTARYLELFDKSRSFRAVQEEAESLGILVPSGKDVVAALHDFGMVEN